MIKLNSDYRQSLQDELNRQSFTNIKPVSIVLQNADQTTINDFYVNISLFNTLIFTNDQVQLNGLYVPITNKSNSVYEYVFDDVYEYYQVPSKIVSNAVFKNSDGTIVDQQSIDLLDPTLMLCLYTKK